MNYLLVSRDQIGLEGAVLSYAKKYNPSDVFWVKRLPDKKEITVEVINQMIEQTNLASVSGKKLFIVFEADLMNTSAQNKLLKTLESTTDTTTVLFLCHNLNNILPTIKSRSIVHYYQTTENLTIKKMRAENPQSEQIDQAARQLLAAVTINQAIQYLPILATPENFTIALDALNQATKASGLPANKQLRVYQALAMIQRNCAINCNHTNTFDWLLLALFQ